jgi:hypothetical protein
VDSSFTASGLQSLSSSSEPKEERGVQVGRPAAGEDVQPPGAAGADADVAEAEAEVAVVEGAVVAHKTEGAEMGEAGGDAGDAADFLDLLNTAYPQWVSPSHLITLHHYMLSLTSIPHILLSYSLHSTQLQLLTLPAGAAPVLAAADTGVRGASMHVVDRAVELILQHRRQRSCFRTVGEFLQLVRIDKDEYRTVMYLTI